MVDEGNGNFGISVVGVIGDVCNIRIVGGESFENVVVVVEIEGEGISQDFSPFVIFLSYISFHKMYIYL